MSRRRTRPPERPRRRHAHPVLGGGPHRQCSPPFMIASRGLALRRRRRSPFLAILANTVRGRPSRPTREAGDRVNPAIVRDLVILRTCSASSSLRTTAPTTRRHLVDGTGPELLERSSSVPTRKGLLSPGLCRGCCGRARCDPAAHSECTWMPRSGGVAVRLLPVSTECLQSPASAAPPGRALGRQLRAAVGNVAGKRVVSHESEDASAEPFFLRGTAMRHQPPTGWPPTVGCAYRWLEDSEYTLTLLRAAVLVRWAGE